MSTIAVNAITDASGGNTASINGATPTTDNTMGRNRIINGAMEIAQRRTSYSQTSNAGNYHTVDRFSYRRSGTWSGVTAVTISQQSSGAPVGFKNFLRHAPVGSDATTPDNAAMLIDYKTEGFDTADLEWGTANAKTVTLSFYVRSSVTGTFCVTFKDTQSSGSITGYTAEYSIAAANTWEYKAIVVPGPTSGTWGTGNTKDIGIMWFISGDTSSPSESGRLVSANSWSGSRPDNTYTANQSDAMTTSSGQTFDITGVQLEAGSVATSFERRSYGQELALCQRYYYRIKPDVAYGCIAEIAHATATTNARARVVFPVTMRTRPTALEQSGTAGDYDVQLGSGVAVCSAVPTISTGTVTTTQVAVVDFPVASGLTIGQAGNIRTPSPGNGYLGWSAEL
jgi:hypothetical protein